MTKTALSDRELLELIARKDGRALTFLYDRYYTMLCRAAFKRLSDENTVEEIVQDVFMVVWSKAENLDPNGDIKGFLFAVLRNKVLYALRTQMSAAAKATFYQIANEIQDFSAVDLLQAKELELKLNNVIEELSPQSREAFKLSRFEQMSYKMIAVQMNVSVGTVEKHISKALTVLRKEVAEFDNTYLLSLIIMLTVFR